MSAISAEDLAQLRQSVDRWVERDYDLPRRKAALASPAGYDAAAWQDYATLGWLGLPIAEAHGGAGLDDAALLAVMTAVGRGLLMEPILSTCVLGAGLIAACATPQQQSALLPDVAGGHVKFALAHSEPRLGYARGPITTQARQDGGWWRLTGEKCFVLDAPSADHLLVTARDPHGDLGLFLVARDAAVTEWRPWRTVDGRYAADLVLGGTPAERLGSGDASAALDHTLDRAILAVSAEAVGAIEALLSDTVTYHKTRKQFGQPLSKFQALQHRLVDMYVALEECKAMVDITLTQMDGEETERQAACSALKVQICRSARLVGTEAVQLHGGIGMTDDMKVGHAFKRLMMIEALFGNADFHLARYAAVSGALDQPSA